MMRMPARSASRAASVDVDFQQVHEHVHAVIAAIAPNDSQGALHRRSACA